MSHVGRHDYVRIIASQQVELDRQAERIRILYRALHKAVGATAAIRYVSEAENE